MSHEEHLSDIFEREQDILNHALQYGAALRRGELLCPENYHSLVREYARLLKLSRRMTKIFDRTAGTLSTSNQDLLDKMQYDALTGIYNRRHLDETLERICNELASSGSLLSVIMVDIDFFKRYNDTYGHNEGDECLKAVARTIAESVQDVEGFAARYGGEEFVVILPQTDEPAARYIASQMLVEVRALNIPHINNSVASCVTVSSGVTTVRLSSSIHPEDCVRRADHALYLSKNNGRNRYTFIDFQEEIEHGL